MWRPSGLSGPGGTLAGRGSPLAACSRRTETGGVQVGSFTRDTILVRPSGVLQPTLPIPMGCVMTSTGASLSLRGG